MQYYRSRLEEREKDKLYQVYISEALRNINNGIVHIGGGARIDVKYYELLSQAESGITAEDAEKQSEITAQEIKLKIQNGLSKLNGGEE